MPTQNEYHVPRSYLKGQNLLVVLAEDGGYPQKVQVLSVNRDTICSSISEFHPPSVGSWARKDNKLRPIVDSVNPEANLKCANGKKIVAIDFASYGDTTGICGSFEEGKCSSSVKSLVENQCLGKVECSVPLSQVNQNTNCGSLPILTETFPCLRDTEYPTSPVFQGKMR
ncbi:hypothetical protein MLD38_032325 [Melastoma candidum]|uniref:Uncharacterized protein n=1 Tax=Melastoma candidum TaxID=119954 RepID=A0ACB9M5J3_9MYRT|nr:hypothetical protein MLD38_032325 [Melastoma candidum]